MKTYGDTRDAIFEELYSIALKDKNVIVLSADTGAMMFKEFQKNIPDQFRNVGISEQNMISVAAGLSLTGKKVFVYGISNFATLRCLEQIRVDICGMNLPVVILGMGAGLTYSSDGMTHHITEDIAIMRALPNMTIYNPSTYNMSARFIHLAYESESPVYIRFDKGPFLINYPTNEPYLELDECFELKFAGYTYAIVSTGNMLDKALDIAHYIQKKYGAYISVIDVYRIKPLSTMLKMELQKYRMIFTLEEHNLSGGFGSSIAELMSNSPIAPTIKRLGLRDTFVTEVGSREYLLSLNKLDQKSIQVYIENQLYGI